MTLVKFEPFRGFESLSRRMNEMFGELEKGVRFEIGDFSPRVDIAEDEKNVYLHAELPGIERENVKISISEDRVLMLKGEKRREEKVENKNYVRVERNYGSFTRSFALPDNINVEKVDAKFENGVLNMTLPKNEPTKPKEVSISIN
ncbi:Hsp20/alpha crystallin family protein [Ignavibacteria bacterium]|nr:Hsp20/alpha crystallin family protein [Bacteroidota bacterium]MCZ2132954.1 Hsp20/alpha crystallin family protein [Bacteroidota bacterium]